MPGATQRLGSEGLRPPGWPCLDAAERTPTCRSRRSSRPPAARVFTVRTCRWLWTAAQDLQRIGRQGPTSCPALGIPRPSCRRLAPSNNHDRPIRLGWGAWGSTGRQPPWQYPRAERVIGTLRRECTDHVIAWNERHLERALREYVEGYDNPSRPHLSLEGNSPLPRTRDPAPAAEIVGEPVLGGLHHRYRRAG